MTVLFFRYLREKRNLLIQFFSKQEEDRKEILETTGYCCFQIFSVLISKTIFIGIFDIRFLVGRWKQLYFVGILREGCHFRMQDERSEDSSVFSVPSLIPSFRERRACAQKFFSFLLCKYLSNILIFFFLVQCLKYLLSGPVQEKFSDLWSYPRSRYFLLCFLEKFYGFKF